MRIYSVIQGEDSASRFLPDSQCLSRHLEGLQTDKVQKQPVSKPSWNSYLLEDKADADFMLERLDVMKEGRCLL